jgi:glycerate kinase
VSRIVIAVDSFKGSIGAAAAASSLAAGWRSVRGADDLVMLPMADGGEGTLDAFATAIPEARRMAVSVTGPGGDPVAASWLLLPPTGAAPHGTAVVELASTSGIELLGARRRPWDAGTTGFGEAIAAALDHGVDRLVLGIGSSASTDGGVGMLTALGARFADASGRPVRAGLRGLVDVAKTDASGLRPLPRRGATVLTDVTNPLLGPFGAAAVFGPQKGLDAEGIAVADDALTRFAAQLAQSPADPAVSPAAPGADPAAPGADPAAPDAGPAAPGAGAAGGTGYALLVWGAVLEPGAVSVADLIGLPAALAEASLVITGEGSFDGQSAAGKAPVHVAALAAGAGVPVALVAGRIAPDADTTWFAASVSLTALAGSPDAAIADPARWLRAAGAALARSLP